MIFLQKGKLLDFQRSGVSNRESIKKLLEKMFRFKILISYNGLKYYGWQKQRKLPTIQGQIEKALEQVFQKQISVIGAGRTDTGTHALGQTAHFDISQPLPSNLCLGKALNAFLVPKDICVRGVWKASDDFHALHSAIEKYYVYFILCRKYPCVFRKGQIYWYPYPLEIKQLNAMSRRITGRHDFKSFQNAGTPVKNTVRNITFARWRRVKKDVMAFHIAGEGFLKQMIRNLVGTQLALLREKEPLKKWEEILLARDRKSAYTTAPAEGLYLYKVSYPLDLDRQCHRISKNSS